MNALIKKATKSDQKIALSSIDFLTRSENEALKNKDKTVTLRVQESDELVTIPLKALMFLKSIIGNMAQGKSIALIPSDSEISTQQAAEILKVSRPHVVKLLDNGMISYRKEGSHRRIPLRDLLDYESKLKIEKRYSLFF